MASPCRFLPTQAGKPRIRSNGAHHHHPLCPSHRITCNNLGNKRTPNTVRFLSVIIRSYRYPRDAGKEAANEEQRRKRPTEEFTFSWGFLSLFCSASYTHFFRLFLLFLSCFVVLYCVPCSCIPATAFSPFPDCSKLSKTFLLWILICGSESDLLGTSFYYSVARPQRI
ncbi:hypothetical protein Taro_016383 [Colocasia esculenta]|uniref:Uncharacterized protein n=1 Tax=Colocasia esculenta TaxID=4460 RepID=A0A843UNN8_COLES|nr:hypothetical protein [Colocasia esculenta]